MSWIVLAFILTFGQGRADAVWVQKASGEVTGTVYARVEGAARPIANEAWRAWLIEDSSTVLYAGSDGAGGFENEGQSLYRFDLATGARKKLLAEYFMIGRVEEVRLKVPVASALLVHMGDGGLGAPHVAIVHPRRGQVYRRQAAAFAGVKNGIVRIADYRVRDLGRDGPEKAKPYRHLEIDLAKVLKGPVIVNEPQHP